MASYDVTALDSPLTVGSPSGAQPRVTSIVKIDDTHFVAAYADTDDDGYIRAFSVDPDTGVITGLGTALEFETAQLTQVSLRLLDSNHVICFWRGSANTGLSQVFTVNLSTWAVTAEGSIFTFYGSTCTLYDAPYVIDSTHVINAWRDIATGDGFAQVFIIDGSYGISAAATAYEFDTSDCVETSFAQVDADHYLLFYGGVALDGFAVVLAVASGTDYSLSTPGSALEFDTDNGRYNFCVQLDSTHFINFWSGTAADGFARCFSVNTSTWAVTALDSAFEFDTSDGLYNNAVLINSNHVLNVWHNSVAGSARAQAFAISGSYAVTAPGAQLELDATEGLDIRVCQLSESLYVATWLSGTAVKAQAIAVEIPVATKFPAMLNINQAVRRAAFY